MKRSAKLFALLCCCCILTIVIFGVVAVRQSANRQTSPALVTKNVIPAPSSPPTSKPALPETIRAAPAPLPSPAVLVPSRDALVPKVAPASRTPLKASQPGRRFLFFRANALGANYGKLTVAALDSLEQPRYAPELLCDRVHFSATVGVCLAADRGFFTNYYAVMFDKDLKPGWRIAINGIPSRTRVSPSGRLAALTIFLSGHSYASLQFSTQTVIVNAANGHTVADLETFAVMRDGLPFQSPDFNFWGVTFAHDENQFYATLWSQGKTYLVKCDLRARTAAVIYQNVECPSLSPDNTRIAFKMRSGAARVTWRIHVLDLKTMTAVPTAETHSVDDQVEWLDNDHLLYSRSESETGSSASTDIWEVPVSGDGVPTIFLKGAFSPAIAQVG